MTEIRPRRSVLAMPGSNARALEKARGLPCDVVMIDLEDAVAPETKATARDAVAAAVAARGFGRREVVVRINPLDGDHGEDDLAALARAAPDAVVVPKVTGAEALVAVGSRLRRLKAPAQTRIWAMIESPLAILNLADIAEAMDDDLNIAGALAHLFTWSAPLTKQKKIPFPQARSALHALKKIDHLLGIIFAPARPLDPETRAKVDELMQKRAAARAAKDWPTSDALRKELTALNVEVKDTPTGSTVTPRLAPAQVPA